MFSVIRAVETKLNCEKKARIISQLVTMGLQNNKNHKDRWIGNQDQFQASNQVLQEIGFPVQL